MPHSPLRKALIIMVSASLLLALVFQYREVVLERFAPQAATELREKHLELVEAFQSQYHFAYDSGFLPRARWVGNSITGLKQFTILDQSTTPLFQLKPSGQVTLSPPKAFPIPVVNSLENARGGTFLVGWSVWFVLPGTKNWIIYEISPPQLKSEIAARVGLGILFFVVLLLTLRKFFISGKLANAYTATRSIVAGLRAKTIITVISIHFISSAVIYFTFVRFQENERRSQIILDAEKFSGFSTQHLASLYAQYGVIGFEETFLPGIKETLAIERNLKNIRILTWKNPRVIFDGEKKWDESTASVEEMPANTLARLEKFGTVVVQDETQPNQFFRIFQIARNRDGEPYVIFDFQFEFVSLKESIEKFQKQLVFDLLPGLILSLIVALVFSQILISPIRKLLESFKRVAAGDFDASIDLHRSDELGQLVSAFNVMTEDLKQKRELQKFLSDSTYRQVVQALERSGGKKMGGSKVNATILFTDIRDFVSLCESQEAEEVTSLLNDYFTEMVEIVGRNGGEVDKFIGDAILAVFYASSNPSLEPSPAATAVAAVQCALEMQERIVDFNRRRALSGRPTIQIGAGLSFGEVISGPVGARDRMDFTVIGDVVNVASRIEKLSKQGKYTKIMFSESVMKLIGGLLDYAELTVHIRGKEEESKVFELMRIRDLHELLALLKSPNVESQRRSAEILGQSRNPEAINSLWDTLGANDEVLRVKTVQALTRLCPVNDDAVIHRLFERLEAERSEVVLSALMIALGKLCRDDRILRLTPYLNSPNERVAANVVEALAESGNPKCHDLILPCLYSKNNRVKANAALALFAGGRFEVVSVLKLMLLQSDPLMRSSAAFALGELTRLAPRHANLVNELRKRTDQLKEILGELQECVPMLVNLLRDPELSVRRQAVIALGKIRDRSSILPIIDSIRFNEDSKDFLSDLAEALRSIGSHKMVREVLNKFL